MFLIFGTPRSGTTLLAQCLSAHPQLIVPDETHFIVPAAFVFDRIADVAVRREILKPLITKSRRTAASLGEFLDEATICDIIDRHSDSLASLLCAIYDAIAEKAGALQAGDKTPNDMGFLGILIQARGIPDDAKIVHIVRDPRDVLSSLRERRWNANPEKLFPRTWNNSNLNLHAQFHSSRRYRLVRYEDLVRSPLKELARLCIFLGVSCDFLLRMIDQRERHARYHGQAHHARLYEPISDAAIGRFRTSLPGDMIAACERQAAEAMAVFGYDRSTERTMEG